MFSGWRKGFEKGLFNQVKFERSSTEVPAVRHYEICRGIGFGGRHRNARFRNRAERFGFQPGRLILQALSPAATLVCQVSLIRCAPLSSLFVPPLPCFSFFSSSSSSSSSSLDDVSRVSSKRFFHRSKIRAFLHASLFPFSRNEDIFRFSMSSSKIDERNRNSARISRRR